MTRYPYNIWEGASRRHHTISATSAREAAMQYLTRLRTTQEEVKLTVVNMTLGIRYQYTFIPPTEPQGTLRLDN